MSLYYCLVSRLSTLCSYLESGAVDGVFGTSLDSPMFLFSLVLSAKPSSRKESAFTEELSH